MSRLLFSQKRAIDSFARLLVGIRWGCGALRCLGASGATTAFVCVCVSCDVMPNNDLGSWTRQQQWKEMSNGSVFFCCEMEKRNGNKLRKSWQIELLNDFEIARLFSILLQCKFCCFGRLLKKPLATFCMEEERKRGIAYLLGELVAREAHRKSEWELTRGRKKKNKNIPCL